LQSARILAGCRRGREFFNSNSIVARMMKVLPLGKELGWVGDVC
jgi:hypothetical protein